jgi:hypothetical protein
MWLVFNDLAESRSETTAVVIYLDFLVTAVVGEQKAAP